MQKYELNVGTNCLEGLYAEGLTFEADVKGSVCLETTGVRLQLSRGLGHNWNNISDRSQLVWA